METLFMQVQSFFIVLLILIGIGFRRERKKHIRLMSVAMIWDILLILQIEMSRSAILKASKVVANPLMLNIHVAIALSTVLLYGCMVYTGRKLIENRQNMRMKHKALGYITASMRILTFITSFWAVTTKV